MQSTFSASTMAKHKITLSDRSHSQDSGTERYKVNNNNTIPSKDKNLSPIKIMVDDEPVRMRPQRSLIKNNTVFRLSWPANPQQNAEETDKEKSRRNRHSTRLSFRLSWFLKSSKSDRRGSNDSRGSRTSTDNLRTGCDSPVHLSPDTASRNGFLVTRSASYRNKSKVLADTIKASSANEGSSSVKISRKRYTSDERKERCKSVDDSLLDLLNGKSLASSPTSFRISPETELCSTDL